jgi:hypothetical protein
VRDARRPAKATDRGWRRRADQAGNRRSDAGVSGGPSKRGEVAVEMGTGNEALGTRAPSTQATHTHDADGW